MFLLNSSIADDVMRKISPIRRFSGPRGLVCMNDPFTHFYINRPLELSIAATDEGWTQLTPFSESTDELQEEMDEPIKVMSYVCAGKLTLFPVMVVFLGMGSGYLLFYGDKGYDSGYFTSGELWYGLAGAIVSLLSLALFINLVIWLVLRITFTFSPTHFRVLKTGLLRSSRLEFNCKTSSLHYFRTHFSQDRCWLSLVVREEDKFYQIFSWKGQGNQEKRFLKLFKALKAELRHIQRKYGNSPTSKLRSEILSKEEVTLIRPFSRLRGFDGGGGGKRMPVCVEDISVTSFDDFFNHFNYTKVFKPGGSSSGSSGSERRERVDEDIYWE